MEVKASIAGALCEKNRQYDTVVTVLTMFIFVIKNIHNIVPLNIPECVPRIETTIVIFATQTGVWWHVQTFLIQGRHNNLVLYFQLNCVFKRLCQPQTTYQILIVINT